MKVKNIIGVLALSAVLAACGNNAQENAKTDSNETKEEMSVKEETKDQAKSREDEEDSSSEKASEENVIYASFFPIYNLTKQIAGDKFEVKSFTNLKTESHGFEPSAKEIAELSTSKLMFVNGAGMEEWEEAVKNTVDIDIVNTSEGIDLIKASEDDHDHDHEDADHEHDHEDADHDHDHEDADHDHGHENGKEGHEHHHHHGEFDPHIWLDPANGKAQAKVIADKLSEVDPANKDYYMANYEKIAKELDDIVAEYKDKFASVDNKKFIVPHQAFGYLAREFDLEQIPLNSLTSTGEADAKVLKEVSDLAKAEKIKTVFYEMGGSDKEAKTLADEIGAEAKPINTLEFATDEELSSNKTYQEMIKENLEAIYDSLS